MITKSDGKYWSTGITVKYQEYAGTHKIDGKMTSVSGWRASLTFLDDGFNDDDTDAGRVSTQGSLETRYAVLDGKIASGLRMALDTLIADAERLRIRWLEPSLYSDEGQERPADWRALLAAEAVRLGWRGPAAA